jgi:hypothetical protein
MAKAASRRAKPATAGKSIPATPTLYKYRGLSNLQFALDILVNGRMHAAQFQNLNDPMEGSYLFEPGSISDGYVKQLYDQKTQWRILSLSATSNNMLMWSYYAEAHSGFAIGVQIADSRAQVEPVDYVTDLAIELGHADVAKRILCRKLLPWKHEEERRVFIKNASFVKVKILEIVFGISTPADKKELLEKIAKSYWPTVKVRSLLQNQLNIGRAPEAMRKPPAASPSVSLPI